MIVLMSVWPVFRSLPASGEPVCCASSSSAGMSRREIRRRVRVRNAFLDRRVGVDHARRNRRIVRFERLLERGDRLVRRRFRQEDLGAAAPDQHEPIELVVRLELADVRDQLLGQVALVLALLDVRAVEPLDVLAVEHRRHRLDRRQLALDLVEQRRLEHAGRLRSLVAVVFEDVPAAKDELIEPGQRHELADGRRPSFGPLAQPNRAHLRERSDGLCEALPDRHDAGDRRRADGPKSDEQTRPTCRRRER